MPETSTPLAVFRKIFDIPIPIQPLAFFFDSASLVLNSGKSIPDSLVTAADVGDSELRQIFRNIAPRLQYGASLSECMSEYQDRFPEIVMPLIDVGEASGGLPDQTKRLADTFKMQVDFDRKMRYNVYDPKMIFIALSLIVMVTAAIISYVAPDEHQNSLHVATKRVLGVLLVDIAVLLVLVVGRRILRLLYRWMPVRLFVDTVKLAIPGFGQVSRNLSAARWARSFATLWAAGVNISTALEISSRSALNSHYERSLIAAAAGTRTGIPLSVCLAQAQLLPFNLISIIKTCEEIGRLDENIISYAANMEREALARGIEEMNKLIINGQMIFYLFAGAAALSMAAQSG